MTLGYVTGRIAAMCVRAGIEPRQFDVSTLQAELRELKILPDELPPSRPRLRLLSLLHRTSLT